MAKIESICRSFLWKGEVSSQFPALVTWDKVCLPKNKGGLGVCDLRRWNIVAVGKYVWWLMQKKDHLWVKWVHCVYLKDRSWQDYKPSHGSSWAWRRICRVKDKMLAGYEGNSWLCEEGVYTIAASYQWLVNDYPTVDWYQCIWNAAAIPKHHFKGWLWIQGRLLTKTVCDLCGIAEEGHEHLFFECSYSKRCLQLVNVWCNGNISQQNQLDWWREHRCSGNMDTFVAIFMALVYHIWWARNNCRVNQMVWTPETICQRVKSDVSVRIKKQCKVRSRRVLESFLA
ncbi:uncharacterized protein LOC141607335 [Silene latifolia]|uniref:uncharacterized protein LOC141607335 n=1 Tax=Silene latifolia TaxID=37657 RepID=UPI003D776D0D